MKYSPFYCFKTNDFGILKATEFTGDAIIYDSFDKAKHDLIEYLRLIIFVWGYHGREEKRKRECEQILEKIYLLTEQICRCK